MATNYGKLKQTKTNEELAIDASSVYFAEGAVLSDILNYSTEEKVVGTYINGKKIYQKTFTGEYNHNDVLVSGVETLVSFEGMIYISGIWRAAPYFELYGGSVYLGTITLNQNNELVIHLVQTDNMISTRVYVTVRYTKI